MRLFKKIASLVLAATLILGCLPALAESAPAQVRLEARVKDIIEVDGLHVREFP